VDHGELSIPFDNLTPDIIALAISSHGVSVYVAFLSVTR